MIRCPKDSLRTQLALAAGELINRGFEIELLTITLEWERAEHAAEIAGVEAEIAKALRERDRQHSRAMADQGKNHGDARKQEVAESRKEGRSLAWLTLGVGLVAGALIGGPIL